MLAPINYLLENKSPLDSFFGGVNQVQQMRGNDLTNENNQHVNNQYRLQNEATAAAQQRKLQMEAELNQLDTTDINAMRAFNARYPDMAKGVQQAYDALDAKQKQNTLLNHSRIASLVKNGRPEDAVGMLETQVEAYRNAGDEQGAQEAQSMADMIKMSPEAGLAALTWGLAIMSPKDATDNLKNVSDTYIAQDKLPGELDETQAKIADTYAGAKQKIAGATKLGAETTEINEMLPYKQAESTSRSSLNTANSTLAATRATDIPIARADAQAQQAVANELEQLKIQLQSENNQVQRERLGLQIKNLEFKQAQYEAGLTTKQIATNQKNQERLAQYGSQQEALAQSRATITRLLNNKSGLRSATGPIASRLPSTRQDTIRFEKDIETLQSQVFLTQVEKMRGLGALTDFEGKKLETAVANLSLTLSPEALSKNLQIIYDATTLADKRLDGKYKDLLNEVSQNQTGSAAGRSYMQYAN